MVKIALIVAVAENGVIGKDGGLPWRLSSDLKTFRRLTLGKPIIMGRRTFQSLGKPLDGRPNLVVSRDSSFAAAGAEVFPTLDAAVTRARALAEHAGASEIMIIGGAQVYGEALPRADRIYWTEVAAVPDGDTRFPAFDRTEWHEISRDPIPQGVNDQFAAQLVVLERIAKHRG